MNHKECKGQPLDPNQYVASWTPHNSFGDVSAKRDVIVSKLKDVKFEEGQTRNIVLQDTKGATPVTYMNGTYYNTAAAANARKDRRQEAADNLAKYILDLGFYLQDTCANVKFYRYDNVNNSGDIMELKIWSNGDYDIEIRNGQTYSESTKYLSPANLLRIKADRKDISGKSLFNSAIKALRKEANANWRNPDTIPTVNYFRFE